MEYPNWFNGMALPYFERNLLHLAGKPNLHFLQIGAFTGDASLWMAKNILTHNGSILIDVDSWTNSKLEIENSDLFESGLMDFNDVEKVYTQKTKRYKNIIKVKSFSSDFFKTCDKQFDFIYIDGDHAADQVYKDAIDSWNLLKSGGILSFDDYPWGSALPEEYRPKTAIDKFLLKFGSEFDMLEKNIQVWIRKK